MDMLPTGKESNTSGKSQLAQGVATRTHNGLPPIHAHDVGKNAYIVVIAL